MKALLILDIQNDFTGQHAKFPADQKQVIEIIENINKLTSDTQNNNFVPIYIGNEFSKKDPLNIFRNFSAITGTDGCKLDGRLNVASSNYFSKNKSSAFVNESLENFLNAHAINELYITGVFAEACVWATVREALKKDYKVSVLSNCVASGTDKKKRRMIERYKKAGAAVLDVQ